PGTPTVSANIGDDPLRHGARLERRLAPGTGHRGRFGFGNVTQLRHLAMIEPQSLAGWAALDDELLRAESVFLHRHFAPGTAPVRRVREHSLFLKKLGQRRLPGELIEGALIVPGPLAALAPLHRDPPTRIEHGQVRRALR